MTIREKYIYSEPDSYEDKVFIKQSYDFTKNNLVGNKSFRIAFDLNLITSDNTFARILSRYDVIKNNVKLEVDFSRNYMTLKGKEFEDEETGATVRYKLNTVLPGLLYNATIKKRKIRLLSHYGNFFLYPRSRGGMLLLEAEDFLRFQQKLSKRKSDLPKYFIERYLINESMDSLFYYMKKAISKGDISTENQKYLKIDFINKKVENIKGKDISVPELELYLRNPLNKHPFKGFYIYSGVDSMGVVKSMKDDNARFITEIYKPELGDKKIAIICGDEKIRLYNTSDVGISPDQIIKILEFKSFKRLK